MTNSGDEGSGLRRSAGLYSREGDFSGIPISPIDYIEQQLERAGYRVSEVTGRKGGH
jgi:hypothetical protein